MQMNITSSALEPAKSSSEVVCPDTTSVREKSGALVPSGSMVEVTAMWPV